MKRFFLMVLLIGLACVVPAAHASEAENYATRFVSQLSLKGGHLAWQNIRPGQSQRDVEKALGLKLALQPSASPGRGAYTHEAFVTRDGLNVRLGFYKQGGQSVLTEIAAPPYAVPKEKVASVRNAAKGRLRGLRDSGPEFPLASAGGEELDISEHALRLQVGSDGE